MILCSGVTIEMPTVDGGSTHSQPDPGSIPLLLLWNGARIHRHRDCSGEIKETGLRRPGASYTYARTRIVFCEKTMRTAHGMLQPSFPL